MTINKFHLMKQWTLGPWSRLAHITRYSSLPVLHRESVAEHTFFVSIKAFLIAIDIRQNSSSLDAAEMDIQVVLEHAIMHDIDESVTGDIIRPFKYSNKELKSMMDAVTHDMLFDSLEGMPSKGAIIDAWFPMVRKYRLERSIVKLADLWSCVHYAHGESQLGNKCGNIIMRDVRDWVNRHEWHDDVALYADGLVKLTQELEVKNGVQ